MDSDKTHFLVNNLDPYLSHGQVLRELTERLSQEAMEKASLEATLLEREMELRAVRESVHASEANLQQVAL